MRDAYTILGMLVTIVAVLNFLHAIHAFPLIPIQRQLLETYEAIVHGAFNWITWPLGFRIPSPIKDVLFIYGLAGGAFMRTRMAEGIYGPVSHAARLSSIARVLIWPMRSHGGIVVTGELGVSTKSRIGVAYSVAPEWLRRAFDFLLWPRVASQYWQEPMVYFHEYGGTYQTFAADYRPGGLKIFLHDRRLVFAVHAGMVLLSVFAILIINGFLAPPASLLPFDPN